MIGTENTRQEPPDLFKLWSFLASCSSPRNTTAVVISLLIKLTGNCEGNLFLLSYRLVQFFLYQCYYLYHCVKYIPTGDIFHVVLFIFMFYLKGKQIDITISGKQNKKEQLQ